MTPAQATQQVPMICPGHPCCKPTFLRQTGILLRMCFHCNVMFHCARLDELLTPRCIVHACFGSSDLFVCSLICVMTTLWHVRPPRSASWPLCALTPVCACVCCISISCVRVYMCACTLASRCMCACQCACVHACLLPAGDRFECDSLLSAPGAPSKKN